MTDKQHFYLSLMMTSAQVVETSVTVTDNSPFQDYPHLDDHTTRSTVTPGFKPFTVIMLFAALNNNGICHTYGVRLQWLMCHILDCLDPFMPWAVLTSCCVLQCTFYSHRTSLHPGVLIKWYWQTVMTT